ncbi:MAG: hypothetical protein JJU00_13265 [Opitutales bacterium]|nr:hypothetical protein [Opitutales bacterium]
MFAWRSVYGKWLVFSYGEEGEGFNWGTPALREVLFDPYHGAVYWHPILGLAFIGGCWLWWKRRNSLQSATWLLSFLLLWYVHAAWWVWPLGSSFGYRGFDAPWLVLLPGTAFLWQMALSRSACAHAFGAACLVLAVWNINLCLMYCLNTIPRNDPVTYGDVIRASLHTYSMLPEIVRSGFHPGPDS